MYRVVDNSNTYMLTRDEGEACFPEDFLQWPVADYTSTITESDDQVDFPLKTEEVKKEEPDFFEDSQGPFDLNTNSASANVTKKNLQSNNESYHLLLNKGGPHFDRSFSERFEKNTTPSGKWLDQRSSKNPNQGAVMNDGIIASTTHEQIIQTATFAPIYRRFDGKTTSSAEKPDQFGFGNPILDTNHINSRKDDHLTNTVGKDANRLKRSYEPTDGVMLLETPWCKQSKFSAGNLPEGSQMTSSAVVNATPEPTIKTVPVSQIPITAQEINGKLNHPILFNLDTAKVAKNMKDWLFSNNVTQELFANHILNLSRMAAWKFLNYPVAWTAMRSGKRTFTRMYNFLKMKSEMQAAAFKLDLYQNKLTYAPLK